MEVINLKTPLTIRILDRDLTGDMTVRGDRPMAFTSKTFRGERLDDNKDPKAGDHVQIKLVGLTIDTSTGDPWLNLKRWVSISILWGNVLSVQYEHEY